MTNETEAVRAEPVFYSRPRLAEMCRAIGTIQRVHVVTLSISPDDQFTSPLYPDSEIDRLTGEVERLRDELQKAKWESERHWALASGYQREMKAAERRVAELEADSLRYKWIERTYNMAKMGDASNILYAFGLPPDDPMADLSVLIDAAVNSLTQPEADHG